MIEVAPAKLLLDEMLSGTIARQLNQRGLDVVAVAAEPSLVSTADEELLIWAIGQNRALVTANIRDFVFIAREWQASRRMHAGLVYVDSKAFPQDQSLVGALVSTLSELARSIPWPMPGVEVFLRRSGS